MNTDAENEKTGKREDVRRGPIYGVVTRMDGRTFETHVAVIKGGFANTGFGTFYDDKGVWKWIVDQKTRLTIL